MMPKVDVFSLTNRKVGQVELSDKVFAAPVKEALLWEAVRHYLASLRRGTAKTKVRREVAGGGRKPWRQKGTGRARVGSTRSPLWRHGGTVHGPVPRDYSYKLPRKMLLGALRCALSAKLKDGEMKVVKGFSLADHKTRSVRGVLDKLGASRTVLLVDNGEDRNLSLGSRNLQGVTLLPSGDVTVYHLLGHERVLISEAAAKKLSEALSR
jgi:large subunit ribosomal protein L4